MYLGGGGGGGGGAKFDVIKVYTDRPCFIFRVATNNPFNFILPSLPPRSASCV